MKTTGLKTNFPEEYTEEAVVKLEFYATKDCNLTCPWCIHGKKGSGFMLQPEEPLRMDLVNKWMNSDKHKFTLAFTGGEPMLPQGMENMLDILSQVDQKHIDRLYRLEILTNGTMYNDEFFDKMEEYSKDFILHISHKKSCFKWDTVEVNELQRLVDRFGKRAVFFPVITMQNYKDFGKLMKRSYDMGFRTFNVRYDMIAPYPFPFYNALDEAFAELPDDYTYIQSHNICRTNLYLGWREEYGKMNPTAVSAATRSELNFDVSSVPEFFEFVKDMTPAERLSYKSRYPNREIVVAYYALKHGITMVSNQHSKKWYTDES